MLPKPISNEQLRRDDVPAPSAEWSTIWTFALTFNGFKEQGSFHACAVIANEQRSATLTDLRTCLFFEQRRWHHYGDYPDEEAAVYIRSLLQRIHDAIPPDRTGG